MQLCSGAQIETSAAAGLAECTAQHPQGARSDCGSGCEQSVSWCPVVSRTWGGTCGPDSEAPRNLLVWPIGPPLCHLTEKRSDPLQHASGISVQCEV